MMNWKTAWSYLPINYHVTIGTVENMTQRTFFRNNLNGEKIRIMFSNLYSDQSLPLERVTIGRKDRTADGIEAITAVTCQGKERIDIEPGNAFYSDGIDIKVSANDDIVISVYIKESTAIRSVCSTWSARTWHTVYGLNGNFTCSQKFQEADGSEVLPVLEFDPNKSNNLFAVSAIEVCTGEDVQTVALFGDSITHMSYYADALTDTLYKDYPGKITVINRGIGGNRLLRDASRVDIVPGGGTIFGNAGVRRFRQDMYGSTHPDIVIVLIGINDFTHPYALEHYDEAITADEYCEGLAELIRISHENNSRIFLGTVTPFRHEDTTWYGPSEDLRKQANEWIRSQRLSDGIIDFDAAVRKPEDPDCMQDDCHLGDGLHPNSTGGKKMAEAIKIEWIK